MPCSHGDAIFFVCKFFLTLFSKKALVLCLRVSCAQVEVCWWLPRGLHARLCLYLCVNVHEDLSTLVKERVVCNKRAPGEGGGL